MTGQQETVRDAISALPSRGPHGGACRPTQSQRPEQGNSGMDGEHMSTCMPSMSMCS